MSALPSGQNEVDSTVVASIDWMRGVTVTGRDGAKFAAVQIQMQRGDSQYSYMIGVSMLSCSNGLDPRAGERG